MKAWYAEIYSEKTVRLTLDTTISKVRSPFLVRLASFGGWEDGYQAICEEKRWG